MAHDQRVLGHVLAVLRQHHVRDRAGAGEVEPVDDLLGQPVPQRVGPFEVSRLGHLEGGVELAVAAVSGGVVNALGIVEDRPGVQEAPEAASERILLPREGIGVGAAETLLGGAGERPGSGVGEDADAPGVILQFLGAERVGFGQVAVKRRAELRLVVACDRDRARRRGSAGRRSIGASSTSRCRASPPLKVWFMLKSLVLEMRDRRPGMAERNSPQGWTPQIILHENAWRVSQKQRRGWLFPLS